MPFVAGIYESCALGGSAGKAFSGLPPLVASFMLVASTVVGSSDLAPARVCGLDWFAGGVLVLSSMAVPVYIFCGPPTFAYPGGVGC